MENLSLNNTPKSDHKSTNEVELERLERRLRSVQLALEIMTGVCATLPDPEPESTGDGPDEDEGNAENFPHFYALTNASTDEDAIEGDVDTEMVIDDATSANLMVPGSATFLPTLVQPLLALIHPTPLSFPPVGGLSPHPPTTSALSAIHVGALECLNNIFLSLSTTPNPNVASDGDSGRKVWDEVWAALTAVGVETGPGQERRQEIWEVAIGVLWGIGIIWKGFLIPHEEQVKVLLQLCDTSSDPRIKVKCIGTLECLAQHPQSIPANAVRHLCDSQQRKG